MTPHGVYAHTCLLLCLQVEWRGEIVQLSWSPRAYHLKGLLSDEECEHIKKIVSQQKLCRERETHTAVRQQQFPYSHCACAVTALAQPPRGQRALVWLPAPEQQRRVVNRPMLLACPDLPSVPSLPSACVVSSGHHLWLCIPPAAAAPAAVTTHHTPPISPGISSQPVMWSTT